MTGPVSDFQSFVIDRILIPEQETEAREYLDFSTAAQRLRDKHFLTREFQGKNGSWYLVSLIVKSRDESGQVTHLLVSARNMDEQKARELAYQRKLEEAVIEAHRGGRPRAGSSPA